MLFDGIEYAWTRKVRITRKSTTAAAMDLIHSSVSFFGFAPAFSFAGAVRARAAARVWGVGTGLMRAGMRPASRRGPGNIRPAAGAHKPRGPARYAPRRRKFPCGSRYDHPPGAGPVHRGVGEGPSRNRAAPIPFLLIGCAFGRTEVSHGVNGVSGELPVFPPLTPLTPCETPSL